VERRAGEKRSWLMRWFPLLYLLTMEFGTSFPVSKMINIEFYDIEELWRNKACGWNTVGWWILFYFISFVLLPAVGFPLVCHNLRVVCSMNYK
jgi:hypothetical protein